jgi:hypothetical protein
MYRNNDGHLRGQLALEDDGSLSIELIDPTERIGSVEADSVRVLAAFVRYQTEPVQAVSLDELGAVELGED